MKESKEEEEEEKEREIEKGSARRERKKDEGKVCARGGANRSTGLALRPLARTAPACGENRQGNRQHR